MCELWLCGCCVVVVWGVGLISFFFLLIVLESGLTGFFLNLKFVIVVLVLGVGRFGVWVVFVASVLGLFVFFVWCVWWVVGLGWVVRFDLGGRPSGPP